MKEPVYLISWGRNFLPDLLADALRRCEGDLSKAVFLFPHSRPMRYLAALMRTDPRVKKPCIMPQGLTVAELFARFAEHAPAAEHFPALGGAAEEAGLLDRAGLLLSIAREKAAAKSDDLFGLEKRTQSDGGLSDARVFLPWGMRLSALFEECFGSLRAPQNFSHVEGMVTPFASCLLESLGSFFAAYKTGLLERGWTTPGLNSLLAAEALGADPALAGRMFAGKQVFIAGFHLLTGAEDALLSALRREAGAVVYIQADPALLEGKGHWSCEAFPALAKHWGCRLEALPGKEKEEHRPAIQYVQGFDVHSQLRELERMLSDNLPEALRSPCGPAPENEDADDPASLPYAAHTAVVLPAEELLSPVLHRLPDVPVNISMGYPLSRSPLFRLLDTVLRLQENRRPGGYRYRDLLELVRHPCLTALEVPSEAGESNAVPAGPAGKRDGAGEDIPKDALRKELRRFEDSLRRHGQRRADPHAVLLSGYAMLRQDEMPPRPVLALIERVILSTTDGFAELSTPKDMGEAVRRLCALLLECGQGLWKRFFIDAECLYRLMRSFIPELTESALSGEALPQDALFALTRALLEAERAPFEASPLVGLQVLGMLETRLLSFKRVFIPEAVEEYLPGSPEGDPLLPEALRAELGLPSLRQREQAAAYSFFRLVAGADEVTLLWQEAPDAPGIQDGKKKKSRFVEEKIWAEEQVLRKLLEPSSLRGAPVYAPEAKVAPVRMQSRALPVTPAMRELIDSALKLPISPSFLDDYLLCPLKWYYTRILHLHEREEPTEGDDSRLVGNLLHKALESFYTPRLGLFFPAPSSLPAAKQKALQEELRECLFAAAEFREASRTLPADSFAMLRVAGEEHLARYLSAQPDTTPVLLEKPLKAPLQFFDSSFILTGKLDRVDLRTAPDGEYRAVVLDYKTGSSKALKPSLLLDDALCGRLAEQVTEEEEETLLQLVSERIAGVQLPVYLLLLRQGIRDGLIRQLPAADFFPVQAAWVALGDRGEEAPLLPPNLDARESEAFLSGRIPRLLHFLLRRMRTCTRVSPKKGVHCDWCSVKKLCIVGSQAL